MGAKLLSKMGWEEGKGLGVKSDGRTEPIQRSRRFSSEEGVGSKRKPIDDQWWEQLMADAYGSPKDTQSADLFTACEGRRCRPHGTAKLARIDAQDRTVKSSAQSPVALSVETDTRLICSETKNSQHVKPDKKDGEVDRKEEDQEARKPAHRAEKAERAENNTRVRDKVTRLVSSISKKNKKSQMKRRAKHGKV